jgi:hypothetical protein
MTVASSREWRIIFPWRAKHVHGARRPEGVARSVNANAGYVLMITTSASTDLRDVPLLLPRS